MTDDQSDRALLADRQDLNTPIFVPAKPHMPPPAVAFLTEQLTRAHCFLEYGAGGSTRLAAQLGVPHVFSVESDRTFAAAVRRHVREEAKSTGTNARIIVSNIGETGNWGYPIDNSLVSKWPNYPIRVWHKIAMAGLAPDLVLVDGRFRVACFLVSLLKLRPGKIIMFDDYEGRKERYDLVEKYVKPSVSHARVAVFEVPEHLPVIDIALDLAVHVVDKR